MSHGLGIPRKKTTFYVKTFLRYYKVTEHGDITHNTAIFITPTPEKIWYTIERVSKKEALTSADLRGPYELVVYGNQRKCSKIFGIFGPQVMFEETLVEFLENAVGRMAILIVPGKTMRLPKASPSVPQSYLTEFAKIAQSPAYMAAFDGSPSRPRSVFKVKPNCLISHDTALKVLKRLGVGS